MTDLLSATLNRINDVLQGPLPKPVWLSSYLGGGILTDGFYASVADAKAACPEVGRWIEMEPSFWRSEDGKTLIEPA